MGRAILQKSFDLSAGDAAKYLENICSAVMSDTPPQAVRR